MRLMNLCLALLALIVAAPAFAKPTPTAPTYPREIVSLNEAGWRFKYGEEPDAVSSAGFDDSGWEKVNVPHTWNKLGEYALARSAATSNKQGVGWYRLTYNAPPAAKGRRQYLDFAAVGAIADVWVNGLKVGQHKGAFSRFRFDVTAAWKPGQANLIAVKADNSKPAPGSSTQDVNPLAGDFFIHGGIYRGVQLITANDVGIDLLDYGGPGVYVRTSSSEPGIVVFDRNRTDVTGADLWLTSWLTAEIKLRNSSVTNRRLRVEPAIDCGPSKPCPRYTEWLKPRNIRLAAGMSATVSQKLKFVTADAWDGKANPELHLIRFDVFDGKTLVDQFTQPFGIRTFAVDPNKGATLNGKPIKLHGVSRHQDRAGRGYALTPQDHAEDMALIKEMGANSVRMAHYQHADEWADEADKAGMLVWAEIPFTTTPSFTGGEGSKETWANAEQQLRELIRQNYNHPSIVMWSIGNEVDASTLFGASKDPAKPLALLQHLQKIAKEEDPTRPTIFADCCEDISAGFGRTAGEKLAGTADLIGYNRYFGWYYPKPLDAAAQLGAAMDKLHAKHPALPISISEYGAGGAVSQFSDNPTGGFINFIGRPQPEAYESWVHEQSWPVIRDRNYIFGSWVWNMFDFASDLRNEGDAVDINTKGLVTMDRKTKKDAFYYYKAQWSKEPMIHLTDKRYVNRSYSVMDVKAYTNAPVALLYMNRGIIGKAECPDGVCVWKNVQLDPGKNRVQVSVLSVKEKPGGGADGGSSLVYEYVKYDAATFIGPDPAKGIRINAGTNAVTQIGGQQFGSDNFSQGGAPKPLNMGSFGNRSSKPKTVEALNPALYDYWREGEAFSYAIPVPDGKWTVRVHSFEPRTAGVDSTTMSVSANGKPALAPFSVMKEAGGALKGLVKTFPVTVKGGLLKLDFAGQNGKAVVAAIEVVK